MMSLRRIAAVGAAVGALALSGAVYAATPATGQPGNVPAQIRAATAQYHSLAAAKAAGWSNLFADVNGLTCITDTDTPSMGGMGYHWINPANIGSTDPTKPAALIYESSPNGGSKLVGMEYLVIDSPTGSVPQPFLGDQPFMYNPPGNRFLGGTAFWSLHAWVWDHNPSGMYAMWNPRITCP
jgi:hypothetical protein